MANGPIADERSRSLYKRSLFNIEIISADAILLYLLLLFVAYILIIWFPNLPFLAFATQLTLGLGVMLTKRYFKERTDSDQKKDAVAAVVTTAKTTSDPAMVNAVAAAVTSIAATPAVNEATGAKKAGAGDPDK